MDIEFVPADLALERDLILASYVFTLPATQDAHAVVQRFAVGQTTGTWLPVPGLTPELRDKHEARIVRIQPIPAADTTTSAPQDQSWYYATIGVPAVNIGDSIPQLLTTLIGNDASTSLEAKLVDLEFPRARLDAFGGPRFGIDGLREVLGIDGRPLLLNMLKPCTGLTPAEGATIAYETALGGIDMIKDDELLGNTAFSPVVDRVVAYNRALDRAADETGKRTMYIPNVSDRPDRMLDTARRAVDAGARAVMVCYANVGYGSVEALADAVGVPILGHFAGSAPYFENATTGMSSPIASGLLPRLAGADLALVNTPYGGYPITRLQYVQTAQQLSVPRPGLRRTAPIIGGGVHPGTVAKYVGDLGSDIVLGVGGAVQGHPGGPAAGGRAMHQAIDAALEGRDVRDSDGRTPELDAAIEAWGTLD